MTQEMILLVGAAGGFTVLGCIWMAYKAGQNAMSRRMHTLEEACMKYMSGRNLEMSDTMQALERQGYNLIEMQNIVRQQQEQIKKIVDRIKPVDEIREVAMNLIEHVKTLETDLAETQAETSKLWQSTGSTDVEDNLKSAFAKIDATSSSLSDLSKAHEVLIGRVDRNDTSIVQLEAALGKE